MKTREGRTVRIGSARKGYRIWLTPTDAARIRRGTSLAYARCLSCGPIYPFAEVSPPPAVRLSPEASAILRTADALRRAEAEATEAAYLAEHRVVLSEIESAQRRGELLYADGEIARHAPVAPMGLVEVARRRRVDPLVRRALDGSGASGALLEID